LNVTDKVAVCSRSFSRNPTLREELLARYANVTFNDEGRALAGAELIDYLKGHTKAITALEQIDDAVLSALPELRVIGKYGVGTDAIDLDAMRRHGKRLGWRGGVNKRSVSELVIAFAIVMLRQVIAANREILAGQWRQVTGGLLTDKTVGIIGCGHIGKDLISLLQPFGCRILVNDIKDYPDFYAQYALEVVDKPTLMREADIVTLHLPLDASTQNLVSADYLSLMKSTAILINTARGGLVDEKALKDALKNGRLAAAAFDVFANEPPGDHELLALPNFLATPHIGGSAAEAILAMGRAAIDGLDEHFEP